MNTRSRADMETACTPIHAALYTLEETGSQAVVTLLLRAGADVTLARDNGETPLQTAALSGCSDILPVLIAAGADVNAIYIDSRRMEKRASRKHRLIRPSILVVSIPTLPSSAPALSTGQRNLCGVRTCRGLPTWEAGQPIIGLTSTSSPYCSRRSRGLVGAAQNTAGLRSMTCRPSSSVESLSSGRTRATTSNKFHK